MKGLSIGAFLKLLLIECNNSCATSSSAFNTEISGTGLVREFKTEVDAHFQQEHSTSFYAHKLNVTADHLSRTVKTIIGKTAKEYIQARITTEAKRLLYFTDISNKEIAYALGFREPANFSAFFKNCTQVSPSAFKKSEGLSK